MKRSTLLKTALGVTLIYASGVFAVENIHTGTVVVGAGAAGMRAALDLKDAGKDVILIDKSYILGGATNLAATYFVVVGTKEQKAAGKYISVENYIKRQQKMLPDVVPEKLKAQIGYSQENLDYLNKLGANITRVLSDYQIATADGSSLGAVISKVLAKSLKDKGVTVLMGTKADDLLLKNGRVEGVRITGKLGTYDIYAKNVVLATCGFAHNQDLVKKYAPEWAGLPTTTAVSSTGDGLVMALKAGAYTKHLDVVRMNPSVHSENGVNSSLSAARAEGGIMVNKDGKRFCNDYYPDYTQLSRWEMQQPESLAWIIIDDKAMKASKRLQGFKSKGYFIEANSPEELAKKIGVPPENLKATLTKFAEAVKKGKDEEFGRAHNLKIDFTQLPLYAVSTKPGIQVTLGGLELNSKMQVLNKAGKPIPGLYAAGEVTFDGSFRPGPTAVGLYQGHIAAQDIIKNSK